MSIRIRSQQSGRHAARLESAMARSALVLTMLVSLAGAPAWADDGQADQRQTTAALEPAGATTARPPALMPLIAAYVALQGLDVASTYRLDAASRAEANPVVRNALDSPPALIAM